MGRYFIKSPMIPGQNIIGRKAHTVVNVEVVTGQAWRDGFEERGGDRIVDDQVLHRVADARALDLGVDGDVDRRVQVGV
ncbi:MAG: hypothetical protein ACYS3S_21340, partial [Planctomycetota bacterium]